MKVEGIHVNSAIMKSRYIKTKVQKPSRKEFMRVLNTNAISTALSQNGRNQSVLFIVHHTLNEYDQSED